MNVLITTCPVIPHMDTVFVACIRCCRLLRKSINYEGNHGFENLKMRGTLFGMLHLPTFGTFSFSSSFIAGGLAFLRRVGFSSHRTHISKKIHENRWPIELNPVYTIACELYTVELKPRFYRDCSSQSFCVKFWSDRITFLCQCNSINSDIHIQVVYCIVEAKTITKAGDFV